MQHHAFGAGELRLTYVTDVPYRREPRPLPRVASPRAPRLGLADHPDFAGARPSAADDPDFEIGAWPELMDQRRLSHFCRIADWHEDAEDDDRDTGIDDVPQDAREEDGI